MGVDSQKIVKQVWEIMNKKLNVNSELLIQENSNEPLTGKNFNLDSNSLMYLFLEVESLFNIRIDTNNIMNYEFNTIKGVVELIEDNIVNNHI